MSSVARRLVSPQATLRGCSEPSTTEAAAADGARRALRRRRRRRVEDERDPITVMLRLTDQERACLLERKADGSMWQQAGGWRRGKELQAAR